jgi:hypothetical protein
VGVLSVVAASRNDGHGLHLLPRTQVFIDGLADQARRYQRPVELILVEWNPPPDAPPLSEVLSRPDVECFTFRVVTVPSEVHARLGASPGLAFYQMIAKNVGIRRATGDAVLATNIDILLSDELFLASTEELRDRCLYRADRVDIAFEPEQSCNPRLLRQSDPIRINGMAGIYYPGAGRVYPHVRGWADLGRTFANNPIEFIRRASRWSDNSGQPGVRRYRRAIAQVLLLPRLHLNACGDFTLLTRRSWQEIRGYPEWEMFSWNLDSLLLYQAAAAGFAFEINDGRPAFHLEHAGGWTPESHQALFQRLEGLGVPVLMDADLVDVASVIWRARHTGRWRTNLDAWGMPHNELADVRVS